MSPDVALPRSPRNTLPDGLLNCIAASGAISWYQPDVSRDEFWLSDGVIAALGYTRAEVPASFEFLTSILHPADQMRLFEYRCRIIAGGPMPELETEWRFRHKQGHYLWTRSTTFIVPRAEGGAPAGFGMFTLQHLQERRAELQLTEDTLQSVLDEIGQPVVLMSTTGHIVQANAATTRAVAGYATAIAGHFCPFLHADSGESTEPQFLAEVVSTGERGERELWRFGRWWRTFLVPLRDYGGNVSRLLLLACDTTELKEQQAREVAREKALTRALVQEVHHRIKNHLQGLIGLLRSLRDAGRGTDQVIDAAVSRIVSIATVHGLLTKGPESALDLTELVRHIVNTLKVDAQVAMVCSLECGQGVVLSQEEAVPAAIVIGELLTNALKHTVRSRLACVEVSMVRSHDQVVVQIRNGPARLPEKFSFHGGAGLNTGLDLVKALLPRARARLELVQEGDAVRARVTLDARAMDWEEPRSCTAAPAPTRANVLDVTGGGASGATDRQ